MARWAETHDMWHASSQSFYKAFPESRLHGRVVWETFVEWARKLDKENLVSKKTRQCPGESFRRRNVLYAYVWLNRIHEAKADLELRYPTAKQETKLKR